MDRDYFRKLFDKLLGKVIPDLLMNLLSCNAFTKNINYTVIYKCPSRMLEYYFPKGFVVLEQNPNDLKIISNEAKQIINAMYMHDSDYVMNCTTAITSISNTLKNVLLRYNLHSLYNQTKYNGEEEIIK